MIFIIGYILTEGIDENTGYAGYEGKQDAALTVCTDSQDDPVGRRMYRLLDDREALLIPDVDAGDLLVSRVAAASRRSSPRRSWPVTTRTAC